MAHAGTEIKCATLPRLYGCGKSKNAHQSQFFGSIFAIFQSSARFFPITPLWLRLFIKSMATHITVELEDPHKLPGRNSLVGEELVVKNRAYSTTDREHSLLCKICYTRKMDTALQPCHHVSMCNGCTRRVMDRVGWKCTVCGEAVTGVFSINVV